MRRVKEKPGSNEASGPSKGTKDDALNYQISMTLSSLISLPSMHDTSPPVRYSSLRAIPSLRPVLSEEGSYRSSLGETFISKGLQFKVVAVLSPALRVQLAFLI